MNTQKKETPNPDRRSFIKMTGVAGAALGLIPAACTSRDNTVSQTMIPATGPLAQDYTTVFHNPDRKIYVEGCGMVRMPDGAFVAVVPVVVRGATLREVGARGIIPSITYIVRSTDGGKSWQEVSSLPYYSAVPWVHRGTLYLFGIKEGTEYRNDDLFLLRSDDGGKSWSDPLTLFRGHFWNCHTGMVIRDNRLYWAVCDIPAKLQLGPPQRRPRVISGDLSDDPMDPRAWRLSDPVDFPEVPQALMYPELGTRSHSLEPNVIEVRGKIRIISCTKPASQSTAGLAAVYDVEDDGEKLSARFIQYHPRPGGQVKFFILWDEVSQMFWSTANLVVDSQNTFDWWEEEGRLSHGGKDRRFLMLFYGLDGLNWFQAGCIAQGDRISQSFMYATPVVDGDDLVIISRSSINAPDQHDADYATFHRVRNFRELIGLKFISETEMP